VDRHVREVACVARTPSRRRHRRDHVKFKFILHAESLTVLEGDDRGSLFFLHRFEEAGVVRLAGII